MQQSNRHHPVLNNWVRLVPELARSDFAVSFDFDTCILGFAVAYSREQFACLDRDGAQLMIKQNNDYWQTANLTYRDGRGINFQIEVNDVGRLLQSIVGNGIELFAPLEDEWYRAADSEAGNRQFLIQDRDGYLLRFFQDLGTRPPAQESETVT